MIPGIDLLLRLALGLAGHNGPDARLPILFYHRVLGEPDPLLPRTPDARLFALHMSTLSRLYKPVSLDEGVRQLRNGTLAPGSVCVTFDDGYRDNVEIALPILEQHRVPCTFFVSSGMLDGSSFFNDRIRESVRRLAAGHHDLGWAGLGNRQVDDTISRILLIDELAAAIKRLPLDERSVACERLSAVAKETHPVDLMMRPEDLLTLRRAGMTIGGHTVDHPILTALTPQAARAQIVDNRNALAQITGERPTWFAYPNGKPNDDYDISHVQMVREAGYEGALTTSWGAATNRSDDFQLPRISAWQQTRIRMAASLMRTTMSARPALQVQCRAGICDTGDQDKRARQRVR